MQVVLQTPSELVVHDGRWYTVLFGACLRAGDMCGRRSELWRMGRRPGPAAPTDHADTRDHLASGGHELGVPGGSSVGFVAVGIGIFGVQLYRIVTWTPVTANILSSDVGTVSGSKGNTYKPVVVYNYR
jgi:hypothetical protein